VGTKEIITIWKATEYTKTLLESISISFLLLDWARAEA